MHECVGETLEQPFDREIESPGGGSLVIVQTATVRCVDACDPPPAAQQSADQASVHPALGAVAMDHVRFESADVFQGLGERREVRGRDAAAHRQPDGAEGEFWQEGRDRCLLEGPPRHGIAHDADRVPGRRLCGREVGDVAKDAADRCPEDVDDFPSAVCGHRLSIALLPLVPLAPETAS